MPVGFGAVCGGAAEAVSPWPFLLPDGGRLHLSVGSPGTAFPGALAVPAALAVPLPVHIPLPEAQVGLHTLVGGPGWAGGVQAGKVWGSGHRPLGYHPVLYTGQPDRPVAALTSFLWPALMPQGGRGRG